MPVTYKLIASNTLTSSAASVTFSTISQTFTDLLLRCSVRDAGTGSTYGDVYIQYNGNNSAANYSRTYLYASGATALSSRTATGANQLDQIDFSASGSTATASTFGSLEVYIPSYTVSQKKAIGAFGVAETNSANAYINAHASLFQLTTAISSLVIGTNQGTQFDAGSSFFLYGIKNS